MTRANYSGHLQGSVVISMRMVVRLMMYIIHLTYDELGFPKEKRNGCSIIKK